MKKIIRLINNLSVSFVLMSGNSFSQTINSNSRPQAGDVFQFKMDAISIDTSIIGLAATWDFSQLNFPDSLYTISLAGNNTSNTEYFYTNAFFTKGTGQMMHYQSSNLYLNEIGFSSSPGCDMSYNNPLKIMKYPFGYSDTFSNSYNYFSDCPWQEYGGNGSISVKGDGVGTLILPTGTYNNVLRVKSVYYTYNDGTNLKTLKYDWYLSNKKFPLLSFVVKYSYPFATSSPSVKFLKMAINESYAGIQSLKNEFKIVPNPATNYLNIIGNSDFQKAEIFNCLGLKLSEYQIDEIKNDIDISNVENGLYVLVLSNNLISVSQKIVIYR